VSGTTMDPGLAAALAEVEQGASRPHPWLPPAGALVGSRDIVAAGIQRRSLLQSLSGADEVLVVDVASGFDGDSQSASQRPHVAGQGG